MNFREISQLESQMDGQLTVLAKKRRLDKQIWVQIFQIQNKVEKLQEEKSILCEKLKDSRNSAAVQSLLSLDGFDKENEDPSNNRWEVETRLSKSFLQQNLLQERKNQLADQQSNLSKSETEKLQEIETLQAQINAAQQEMENIQHQHAIDEYKFARLEKQFINGGQELDDFRSKVKEVSIDLQDRYMAQ